MIDSLSRFADIFKDDTAPIKFAVLLLVLLVGILAIMHLTYRVE